MRQIKKVTPEEALERLEEQCMRAERSTGEARQKLRQWGIAPDEAERIIASLVKRRFIDDSRFARAFVLDKLRFGHWGRVKISIHLRAKGIDTRTAEEALDLINEDEYRTILAALLTARSRQLDMTDYNERAKLYRFGLSRGFESSLVAAEVRRLRDN